MRSRRILRGALTALVFGCSASLMAAQSTPGRTFVFLVACGDYDRTQFKPVLFTVEEMKLFQKVLIESGVAEKNIIFLHDKAEESRRHAPTRTNILREFKLLMERLRPEDSVIVSLSGHGVQFKGDKAGYFCPLDADLEKRGTLLPMEGEDGLLTLLDQGRAGRKFLIVNACRNNPTSSVNLAAEKLHLRDEYNEEAPRGTVMLLACRQNQYSWFYPETERRTERRNRSLFMYHLVEAWKGTYARDRKVTVDHIIAEVTERVEEDSTRDFGRNQMPLVRRKDAQGDWLVATVSRGKEAAKPVAPALRADPRFKDVVIDRPFADILSENPSWMDTPGVRLVRGNQGSWLLLCVAQAPLEADTGAARINADLVCRNNMAAALLAWRKDTSVKADTESDLHKARQVVQTRIEGKVQLLTPVGRWLSPRSDVYYVLYGKVFDASEFKSK